MKDYYHASLSGENRVTLGECIAESACARRGTVGAGPTPASARIDRTLPRDTQPSHQPPVVCAVSCELPILYSKGKALQITRAHNGLAGSFGSGLALGSGVHTDTV